MAESELATIARPYARAAFSKAVDETDGLETWLKMLALLSAAVSHDKVRSALNDPQLSAEDEADLLIRICGDDLNEKGQNFIRVLAENNRIALIPTITEQFETLKADYQQSMDVSITSAFEVTDDDREKLEASLKRLLQRDIRVESQVDEKLLGGVIIKAEDTVIDNSMRGRLEKLAQVLR